jgi:hypothetical protein
MKRRDEKPSLRIEPSSEVEGRDFAEAVREFEPRFVNHPSDVQREAIQQGIDAAKVVDEFTGGKGSNFFVFGDLWSLHVDNELNLALTTGKRVTVRLTD